MAFADTEDQLDEQAATGYLADLLAAVQPAVLAADHEWQQVTLNEAPTFRALSVLNPDENRLSDIIAELLNPQGSHGQGDAFLKLFRLKCGSIGTLPLNRVSIYRESLTFSIANQRRRMDILVDGETWGIGIENKPWAGEQNKQLQDYADDLENRFGDNFLLIRLIAGDADVRSLDEARHERLSAKGQFESWRYDSNDSKFLIWVAECRKQCQAPRVTTFLDELSRYITAEFATATNPRTDMEQKHLLPALESILEKDPRQYYSVAAISENLPALRQRFVVKLFDEVENDVRAELGPGWSVNRGEETENFVETDWACFAFAHKDWRDLYQVSLESQPKFGLVVLGVHHCKEGITRNDQIAKYLKRLGWGKKGGGPAWEGHSPLPEPFTNWTTPSGFAAVATNRPQLKELLTEEFIKLCKRFRKPLAKLGKATLRKR